MDVLEEQSPFFRVAWQRKAGLVASRAGATVAMPDERRLGAQSVVATRRDRVLMRCEESMIEEY